MSLFFYRIGNWCFNKKIPLIPRFMTIVGRLILGCYIDSRAQIGSGTVVAYGGSGVVIHPAAKIGSHCVISPGVVIGGRSGRTAPTIEDEVKIYSNAAVLGEIVVGRNSVIGANVVVTNSVAPNAILVSPKPRHL